VHFVVEDIMYIPLPTKKQTNKQNQQIQSDKQPKPLSMNG
jgi:hypothetical protein